MHSVVALCFTVLLGFAASLAHADPVPAVLTSTGPSAAWRDVIGANQSASAGWSFQVGANAVQVQALGMYDASNGLLNAHPIGLWTSGGTLLAQTTIPAGTSAQRIGSYRYVSITPLTLSAGQTYVVGIYLDTVVDQCGSACGDKMIYRGQETYDPRITFRQSRQTRAIIGSGPLSFPDLFAQIDEGFFGPNFLLSADVTPNAFAFVAQNGVAPATQVTSNAITVSGIDIPSAISIVGGRYSINGAASTSVAGTVSLGDAVTVQLTSASTFSTLATATLTIGGVSGAFNVTTRAADTTPDAFAFVAQTGMAPTTQITSNAISVSGIDSASAIGIVGGRYSINGAAYATAASTVSSGDTVTVQLTSAPTFSTLATATLTIGGVSGAFNVTTRAADTTPGVFAFVAQTGVAPSSQITSNAITVSGIDSTSTVSILGGRYSINGAAFTSTAGKVSLGDAVTVQLTAASTFATLTTATLTIGSVSGEFHVTTRPADTTPNAFAFVAQTGVAPATQVTSNTITVSGIDSPSAISIVGGRYSINGAAYTTAASTVSSGDTVTVQLTTASTFAALTTATLNIGGVIGVFNATTGAAVLQPVPMLGSGAAATMILLLAIAGLVATRRTVKR